MTELLYLHDAYVREFDANVIKVEGNRVFLDRSYFYPTSGGQPCDKGKIFSSSAIYEVTDVRKDNNIYTIFVDKEGLKEGDIVKCKLDWERRYKLMKLHTATHILSAILHNKYNCLITGGNLDLDKCRIDFNADINKNNIKEIEELLNQEIQRNHKVEIKFYRRKEIEGIEKFSRLAKGIPEDLEILRVVIIGDLDAQFDGGTHVNQTSEIGKIEILHVENKGKNNKRIYYRLAEEKFD
ncbi:MAG: alanyl-tRNA editing protein [Candidatus Micrarchaeota archaeon]|nr:alanyl-tRNA editing protein [Candidatus Micrarchaeota archaeon]